MTTCYHPDKRLFFIHIPKCAGTSIGGIRGDDGIHRDCWLEDNLPGWTREGLPNGHQPVRSIEMWTGKPIDYWDKIVATIRNPFEQQISQWQFWRDRGLKTLRMSAICHMDDRLARGRSLEQFVLDDLCNGPNSMVGRQWEFAGGLYRWWLEVEGQIPANVHVIRVEDLPEALYGTMAEYVDNPTELPRFNRTHPVGEYWQHYTPAAIEHILKKFAWSFAMYYQDVAAAAKKILASKADPVV